MEKKNNINSDVVKYVAGLSRLSLNPDEIGKFESQLSQVLDYIEQLSEVDVENIVPTTHVLPTMKNVFREDEPKESLTNSRALSNAPEKDGEFFKVPKVI